MDKLIIVGAGGFGRTLLETAREHYDCSFVDDAYDVGTIVCDAKVVGHLCDLKELIHSFGFAIVGIGNNVLREKITLELIRIGFHVPTIVSSKAYVSPYSKIGFGTIILPFASIQNGAVIGNGVIVSSQVEVHHDCCIKDYVTIYPNSTIRTCAIIENRVKIGSNVSVGNSVAIKSDTEVKNGQSI